MRFGIHSDHFLTANFILFKIKVQLKNFNMSLYPRLYNKTINLTKRYFSDVPAPLVKSTTSSSVSTIKSSDYIRPKSRLIPFLFGALISMSTVYVITVNEVNESYKKLENSLKSIYLLLIFFIMIFL